MLATQIRRVGVEAPALTDLQRALLESGVKILNEDDVREYKREKEEEANKVSVRFFRGAKTVKGLTHEVKGLHVKWRRYSAGCAGSGMLSVDSFTIPPEITDICQKIASTGVSARFDVDQIDADLFMIVGAYHTEEEYVIGVWDERGFIG